MGEFRSATLEGYHVTHNSCGIKYATYSCTPNLYEKSGVELYVRIGPGLLVGLRPFSKTIEADDGGPAAVRFRPLWKKIVKAICLPSTSVRFQEISAIRRPNPPLETLQSSDCIVHS